MIGHSGGVIRILEERLGRPLQWSMCLLDCNELPLRHVFWLLDGVTIGPDSFSGKIGKMIGGVVSNWDVKDFQPIACEFFLCLVMKPFEMLVMTRASFCDLKNLKT